MPRYVYRLDPAIFLALVVAYRPGEWEYTVRARSEAAAVSLALTEGQAVALAEALAQAAAVFAGGSFPLARVRPAAPEDPLLRGPFDLEARAEAVEVMAEPRRRRVLLLATGCVEALPYQVSIAAIPEQGQALAEQAKAALQHTVMMCPVCGRPHPRPGEACDHPYVMVRRG